MPEQSPKTFTVTYPDGTEKLVMRFPPTKLEEANAIAQRIYERFCYYFNYSDACLGDVLSDKACWGHMVQLANMLPVAGQDKPGIDLDCLGTGGDYEQIGHIFITQSINPTTGTIALEEGETVIKPSKFAELHKLHFFRRAAMLEANAAREKEQQTQIAQITKDRTDQESQIQAMTQTQIQTKIQTTEESPAAETESPTSSQS